MRIIFISFTLSGIPVIFYVIRQAAIMHYYKKLYKNNGRIRLRKFPYPYKATFTIANDIDETFTCEKFLKIQHFLNTKDHTSMGVGVGLDIGNSFFPYDDSNYFSYFSNNPIDKIVIQKMIKAGYIDSIHSWGGAYTGRQYAVSGIEEFKREGIQLDVWINHSKQESNIGNWFSTNLGDKKQTNYYHTDLTLNYGIKFIWMGSCSAIIGQTVPITLRSILFLFDHKNIVNSLRTILLSITKHLIAFFTINNTKYALHGNNDLIRIATLADGRKAYEFMRYDAHPDGIGHGASSKNLHYNISERLINRLIKVGGYAILYAHFGKNDGCTQAICENGQYGLRYLEKKYRDGELYITTTSRVLNYYLNHKHLKWSVHENENDVTIVIHSVEDPVFGSFVPSAENLQGITFYIPSGKKTRLFINDKEVLNIKKNNCDEIGIESIMFPINNLKYPEVNSAI